MKSLMLKAVVVGVALVILLPLGAHAANTQGILHQACGHSPVPNPFAGCDSTGQQLDSHAASGTTTYLQDFTNVFLYAAGTVALIFLILGGIRYITSTGDSARIKAAKDTILYAIIGLIVTILAFPIAGYVIKTVGG